MHTAAWGLVWPASLSHGSLPCYGGTGLSQRPVPPVRVWTERSVGAERLAQHVDCLLDRAGGGRCRAQWVEHHEIVVDVVVTDACGTHAGLDQLACVGLPLVAEDVVLVDDHEG